MGENIALTHQLHWSFELNTSLSFWKRKSGIAIKLTYVRSCQVCCITQHNYQCKYSSYSILSISSILCFIQNFLPTWGWLQPLVGKISIRSNLYHPLGHLRWPYYFFTKKKNIYTSRTCTAVLFVIQPRLSPSSVTGRTFTKASCSLNCLVLSCSFLEYQDDVVNLFLCYLEDVWLGNYECVLLFIL